MNPLLLLDFHVVYEVNPSTHALINSGNTNEGLLNMIEMAFRAYDPCLACATHSAVGQMPLQVNIYDHNKKMIKVVRR